jgi:hypothetical protein
VARLPLAHDPPTPSARAASRRRGSVATANQPHLCDHLETCRVPQIATPPVPVLETRASGCAVQRGVGAVSASAGCLQHSIQSSWQQSTPTANSCQRRYPAIDPICPIYRDVPGISLPAYRSHITLLPSFVIHARRGWGILPPKCMRRHSAGITPSTYVSGVRFPSSTRASLSISRATTV